jgi:5-formyltetrahydrofolate cyclo-ligase
MTTSAKREVRHAARALRRRLAADLDPAIAGAAIADAVLRFVPEPSRVAVYESLPGEPPTGPLIAALLASGHEVIVPVVLHDYSLEWRRATAGSVGDRSTVSRRPEGAARGDDWLGTDALSTCDLVVVPGLAVDRLGTRLGQGGGCYDRALLHRDASAPVVALLHDEELVEADLPRDAHDVPVDAVVTTTGRLVRVGQSGARG